MPGELMLYEILKQRFDAFQPPQGIEMHTFRSPAACQFGKVHLEGDGRHEWPVPVHVVRRRRLCLLPYVGRVDNLEAAREEESG